MTSIAHAGNTCEEEKLTHFQLDYCADQSRGLDSRSVELQSRFIVLIEKV